MKKYEARITAIGDMVEELLHQGMLVLFDETAPKELQEISVVHSGGLLAKDVATGDLFIIDNMAYTVTAVGELANKNLKNIGHICLKFDSKTSPELPGDVHLKGEKLPHIKIGGKIVVKEENG